MKKIWVLVAIAIIGIGGWYATVNASESNIEIIGTLQYYNLQTNLLANDTIGGNVTLTFVYSEMNESDLVYEKLWYNNQTNLTACKFTTQKVYVDWWFVPEIKYFVYQDTNTNKLYAVGVNYTDVDLPESPVEILNETNNTLNAIRLELDNLTIAYNSTLNKLNATENSLNETTENYTLLIAELAEVSHNLTLKQDEFNETYDLWLSANTNMSLYKTHFDNVVRSALPYVPSGSIESTARSAESVIQKNAADAQSYKELSGSIPMYIIVTILATVSIIFVIFWRKKLFGYPMPTSIEAERDTGYNKEARNIDRFVSGVGSVFKGKQTVPNNPGGEDKVNRESEDDLHKQIDEIGTRQKEFEKTVTNDVRHLNSRVDTIEKTIDGMKTGDKKA